MDRSEGSSNIVNKDLIVIILQIWLGMFCSVCSIHTMLSREIFERHWFIYSDDCATDSRHEQQHESYGHIFLRTGCFSQENTIVCTKKSKFHRFSRQLANRWKAKICIQGMSVYAFDGFLFWFEFQRGNVSLSSLANSNRHPTFELIQISNDSNRFESLNIWFLNPVVTREPRTLQILVAILKLFNHP